MAIGTSDGDPAEHTNLEVGDLVLVTNQSTTDRWPLARVTEIQPGSDGLVRVATIKLQGGCVTRAITNLAKLPIHNDVVLRGHRIILPDALRDKAIDVAHKGYQGICKTKNLLRSKVWFPNLDGLTEEKIKSCLACQATSSIINRAPIITQSRCTEPFKHVDVDYAGPFPNGKYIFLLIDEYSRYPIVDITPSTNFHNLKTILEKTFTTFGIPEQLKSDNGPPFNSQEFTTFLKHYGIRHHKVTPYWPQANGMVERFVKTVKRSLICANLESSKFDSQLNEFLLNFRSTPHSTTTKSPYELLFGRKMRNYLPTQETDNKGQPGQEKHSPLYHNKVPLRIVVRKQNEELLTNTRNR
ncbi:Integrase zinc binding domain [Popillia japonica]|uniref:RNA-directed DNA polymerase n=1 Tax=Popillia japonica TaxID=7064 RepID=A0AAW1LW08_POPJA